MVSLLNLYMNVVFLPFYKPAMNIANVLHGCVFAWATLMFLCAYMRGIPEVWTWCWCWWLCWWLCWCWCWCFAALL